MPALGTRLISLELVNFRSHAKSRLEFDGRPLVVTGRNGSGKTNLLEAISLFSPGRGLRRAGKDELARAPENLGWKLVLSGENPDAFEIVNQARFGEARQVLIDDKPKPQSAMAHYLRPIWMVPSQDRLWMDSASERRKFFDRLVMSFVPEHGDAVLRYEKAMRERNRLLKDQISDDHWYRAIEEQMAAAARDILANRQVALARLNAVMALGHSSFPQGILSLSYEADFDAIDDAEAFWASTRREERYAGTTKYGAHKVEFDAVFVSKNQRAALCSTGEQKALLTSLILSNARALIEDGEFVVILLDEVAAHLDEERRAHLFDELADLPAQVVMTGTEASLFDAMGARGVYVEIFEENLTSRIEPK